MTDQYRINRHHHITISLLGHWNNIGVPLSQSITLYQFYFPWCSQSNNMQARQQALAGRRWLLVGIGRHRRQRQPTADHQRANHRTPTMAVQKHGEVIAICAAHHRRRKDGGPTSSANAISSALKLYIQYTYILEVMHVCHIWKSSQNPAKICLCVSIKSVTSLHCTRRVCMRLATHRSEKSTVR